MAGWLLVGSCIVVLVIIEILLTIFSKTSEEEIEAIPLNEWRVAYEDDTVSAKAQGFTLQCYWEERLLMTGEEYMIRDPEVCHYLCYRLLDGKKLIAEYRTYGGSSQNNRWLEAMFRKIIRA